MRRRAGLARSLLAVSMGAVIAAPVAAGAQRSPWLPRARLENDAYNFWRHPGRRPDEEYTNGVALWVEALRAPWWGRGLGGGRPGCDVAEAGAPACLTTLLGLGQDLYTPNLDRPPFSSPAWEDERPYAAWLYLTGGGRRVTRRTLRAVDLSLGVTGEPALGTLSQRIAHALNRRYTRPAAGWETQVGFEPGVLLSWRESWLSWRAVGGAKGILDLVPFAGASLGTVRTGAEAGARLRVGYNVSHPWDPRAWRGRGPIEYFATVGLRRELVARDFSLDGTLVAPERRVRREPVVDEYEVGLGVRMWWLSAGWRATTRGREYATGPRYHPFSAMYAAWEFTP